MRVGFSSLVRLRHSRRFWPAPAFTLIELMVVIVIIGVSAAAILPQMQGSYDDVILRSASRELVDVLSLAYSRAVSLNKPHRVTIDESSGAYQVEFRAGSNGGETIFAPLKSQSGCSGKLNERLTITVRSAEAPGVDQAQEDTAPIAADESETHRRAAVTFYPNGTADAREILLKDRHDFGLALRINPTTSRIQIKELKPK